MHKNKNAILFMSLLLIFTMVLWRFVFSDYAKINKLVDIMDKTTQVEVIENNNVKHFGLNEDRDFFSIYINGVKHYLFTTKETKELEKNLVKSHIRIKYYNGADEIGEAEVFYYNSDGKTNRIYYMNDCYFTPQKDLSLSV